MGNGSGPGADERFAPSRTAAGRRAAGCTAAALLLATAACDDDAGAPKIVTRWSYGAPAAAAPPGVGPERRVIVAVSDRPPGGSGQIVTLEATNGITVEGPFEPAELTVHAPVVHGTIIYVVSKVGRVVAVDFAGGTKFTVNGAEPLGQTGPLAVAPDGSLRLGTASGDIVGLAGDDGRELFRTPVGGAVTSPLGIAADGTTFGATDTGRVVGVDGAGGIVFDVTVGAPASGPSASADRVVVGDADGVVGFDRSGQEVFDHPRAARVVGTAPLPGGDFVAWGEDGILERLSATGEVSMRFTTATTNPPPIYASPVAFDDGRLGVFDGEGTGHLVGLDGNAVATYRLAGPPLTEVAVTDRQWALVAVGQTVQAIDFMGQ